MRTGVPVVPLRHAAIVAFCLAPGAVAGQSSGGGHATEVPEVRASPRTAPITLDGALDEPIWATVPAATDFRQTEPHEGEPATQHTEVRVLFDDRALYVGARMLDELGAAGVRTRLVRRDAQPESDYISVLLDTYHDHVGTALFRINPSGAKSDFLNGDSSWDPVWEAATRIDSLGWTAELRIPLAQLRFPRAAQQLWGLQIERRVHRLNEWSQWSFWRRNESGGPARYGHLTELRLTGKPGRAEVLPYVVAQSSHLNGDPADPFHRSSERQYRLGLDVKYLATSNLTLSATINPDFGQVEVDPAVVNLSAFETFFQERRPFFVEGSDVFDYGGLWCFFCSNVSSLGLFYSRRIGRSPQGAALARDAGDFADVPESTTILGAAKLTGQTAGGWSVGVLDALTARETAAVIDAARRSDMAVEPLTNYVIARVKRNFHGGDRVVGAMATSTLRDLDSAHLSARLNRHAESVGLDTELWWRERTYHVLASAAVSHIGGDSAAIERAQESSARYFQRPDRQHGGNGVFSDAYEPGLTAMRGYGLYARVAKESGNWLWESAINLRSPGFEVNDLAFLTRADYIWMNANVLRQWTQPTKYYRQLTLLAGGQQQFNYDGDLTDRQFQLFGHAELPNYWNVSSFLIRQPGTLDDRLTRGGPVVRRTGNATIFLNVSTDSRHSVVLNSNPRYSRNDDGVVSWSANAEVQVRPASNVAISLGPAYALSRSPYQYVTDVTDATAASFYGKRYVFSDLEQRTLSMNTRWNVTFTPTLSFELFAQPLLSSANFENFKEFAAPRQRERLVYGKQLGTIAADGSGSTYTYTVDPDGAGPAASFTFDDPDFNFRSLRGNAVLRWEYLPGSTLFLVWTQERSDVQTVGNFDLRRDRAALFDAEPNNIFLLKVNYWLGF